MTVDFLLETLTTVVGIVSSIVMLPQVYSILKRRSGKDTSILTYLFLFGTGIVRILYGNIQSSPLIILI